MIQFSTINPDTFCPPQMPFPLDRYSLVFPCFFCYDGRLHREWTIFLPPCLTSVSFSEGQTAWSCLWKKMRYLELGLQCSVLSAPFSVISSLLSNTILAFASMGSIQSIFPLLLYFSWMECPFPNDSDPSPQSYLVSFLLKPSWTNLSFTSSPKHLLALFMCLFFSCWSPLCEFPAAFLLLSTKWSTSLKRSNGLLKDLLLLSWDSPRGQHELFTT